MKRLLIGCVPSILAVTLVAIGILYLAAVARDLTPHRDLAKRMVNTSAGRQVQLSGPLKLACGQHSTLTVGVAAGDMTYDQLHAMGG